MEEKQNKNHNTMNEYQLASSNMLDLDDLEPV